jgi:signal transduction histidine kinase/ActR/RegA family two-component response regulator
MPDDAPFGLRADADLIPGRPREAPGDATHILGIRVSDARVRMLYERNLVPTLMGAPFAGLICWFLWNEAERALLLTWFALKLVSVALRVVLHATYTRRSTPESAPRWASRYGVLLAIDGVIWSLLMIWFAPADRVDIAAVMVACVIGVAAVGAIALACDFRANATFALSTLLPAAVSQIGNGTPVSQFAGIGLVMYLGVVLFDARRAGAATTEMLKLRFTMDELAGQRAAALALAERQSAVKSQFLATMSHEMRTPLHGMLGTLGLLRGAGRTADPDPQLALVERAGEHLLGLINDVLDFSRLEAGHLEVQSAPFDVASVLHEAVELSAAPAAAKGLDLHLASVLPERQWIQGDPSRFRQVLLNLIGNAVKFTDDGSVDVVADLADGRLRVTVRDTGIGIPPEDVERIFDPFQQADSSFSRRFAGTGLGLTISRELARAMGGDLRCTSAPGVGSTFTFELPWQTADAPLSPVAPAVATPGPALSGRVLLADDNPVNVLVAKGMLQRLGLTVTVVTDGAQAVASYLEDVPAIVLMDCHMPEMDGFEATQRIRAEEHGRGWPRTPIIAVTANAFRDDRDRSLAAGMDEHLAKPFRLEDLRACIAPFLAGRPAAARQSP